MSDDTHASLPSTTLRQQLDWAIGFYVNRPLIHEDRWADLLDGLEKIIEPYFQEIAREARLDELKWADSLTNDVALRQNIDERIEALTLQDTPGMGGYAYDTSPTAGTNQVDNSEEAL